MSTKIIKLVERDAVSELDAYFRDMPATKPLDVHDELVLLTHFSDVAVKSYINRFRFSEKAEICFIENAPEEICLIYINYYGLRETTQKYVIDNDLLVVARAFLRMRRFDDVEYLLKNGSAEMIRLYLMQYALNDDAQVLKLLENSNESLFSTYVGRGRFISEEVIKKIVSERRLNAFKAVVARNYRRFRKVTKNMSYADMLAKKVPDVMLSEEIQLAVLESYEHLFIQFMLGKTPLLPKAQEFMLKRNFDSEWFRFHVEHLYGVGGYRFEPEFEELLFKKLASKNLDECLTKFCLQDDVSFVKLASAQAVLKYIKDHWLSDEAQVALVLRGDANLIKVFIQRFTPEHGMCWQAEVEMAKIYSSETIKPYISFHSMCSEGLNILRDRCPELIGFYYEHHAY